MVANLGVHLAAMRAVQRGTCLVESSAVDLVASKVHLSVEKKADCWVEWKAGKKVLHWAAQRVGA